MSQSPVRWWVCALLLLATTLNYMDRVALNQLAKPIREAFQLTNADYGKIESGFAFAFGIGTLLAGWLVDRVSVRWVYPALVLGWSAAGFLTGSAYDFWSLLACRVALGLFEAGNWPCGIRTTRQVLPPTERALGNSLFQSGTAIGAIITPMIVLAYSRIAPNDPEAWRMLFRIIGFVGVVWIIAWLVSVPQRVLDSQTPSDSRDESSSFLDVLLDPRFLILIVVILAVNTSWHTFRVWMPLFLTKQHGYSQEQLQWFSIAYYLCADVGSWTVGLATIYFTKRGTSLHTCRVVGFGVCAVMVLASLGLLVVRDPRAIQVLLLVFGFGALGLFPTYFSISQELSAKHQGKVTGTLGCINAVYLAGLYPLEGVIADRTQERYEYLLAAAGLPAVVALVIFAQGWQSSTRAAEEARDSRE